MLVLTILISIENSCLNNRLCFCSRNKIPYLVCFFPTHFLPCFIIILPPLQNRKLHFLVHKLQAFVAIFFHHFTLIFTSLPFKNNVKCFSFLHTSGCAYVHLLFVPLITNKNNFVTSDYLSNASQTFISQA